jgi:hypothetical protein
MSDYFFTTFYNQVKDQSWPQIHTYTEFLKLPDTIQQECFQLHNLRSRLDEIHDQTYWFAHSSHNIGYQQQNVVYVPVMKCANTYYVNLFHDQNKWKPVKLSDLNLDSVHLFGLILHPLTRRIKGIAEVLSRSYGFDYKKILLHLQQPEFATFISSISTLDAHTIPYSLLFGDLFEKIQWIPMDLFSDSELQQQIKKITDKHNVTVNFPEVVTRKNQSDTYKIQCFKELEKIYLQTAPPAELYKLFSKDLALYHTLIESNETSNNNNS